MPTDLKTHIKDFKAWLKSDTGDGVAWQKERKERPTETNMRAFRPVPKPAPKPKKKAFR